MNVKTFRPGASLAAALGAMPFLALSADYKVETDELALTVSEVDASFRVQDKRTGRVWESEPKYENMPDDMAVVSGEASGREIKFERMLAATDARDFVTCGVPIAVIGTQGHGAHAADEWDSISSMDQMRDVLIKFLSQEAKAE